jgi:hypothetical protein
VALHKTLTDEKKAMLHFLTAGYRGNVGICRNIDVSGAWALKTCGRPKFLGSHILKVVYV